MTDFRIDLRAQGTKAFESRRISAVANLQYVLKRIIPDTVCRESRIVLAGKAAYPLLVLLYFHSVFQLG